MTNQIPPVEARNFKRAECLSRAIDTIGQSYFLPHLMDYLRVDVPFVGMLLLLLDENNRPFHIYDTIRAAYRINLDMYLDGLYQLVVLCPPAPGLGSGVPFEPVLMDSNWLSARALGVGDPSPWRSTTKLSVGRLRGVRAGAAVTAIGARLIGRVTHAGLWSSDVSFLADPGFRVVAVGLFEGEEEPRVLGRFVSRGRTRDGAVRFAWIVRYFGGGGGAISVSTTSRAPESLSIPCTSPEPAITASPGPSFEVSSPTWNVPLPSTTR